MTIGPLRLSLVGSIVVLSPLLVTSPQDAEASHMTHLAIRYNREPNSYQGPWDTAAMKKWALDHSQAGFCVDGNYPSIAFDAFRAAVADWNSAIVVPGGVPLVENCAWQVGFRPGYANNPNYPNFFDICGYVYACTTFDRGLSYRGGYYNQAADIWLNLAQGFTWLSSGYRAAAAHELGHVFGLDEQYLHSGVGCAAENSATISVMDAFTNSGKCDGNVNPTTSGTCDWNTGLDEDRVCSFYNMRTIPMDPTLYLVSNEIYRYYFTDRQWAESNYQEIVQRWDGAGTWVDFGGQNDNNVNFAPCDDDQPCVLNDIFAVSGSGYFRVCLVSHNGVYGARPRTCSGYVYDP